MLSADEVTRYMRIASRANFLAQDRMDIAHARNEATRRMTSPTRDDWNKLVNQERYLVRYPRVVNWYKDQNESDEVVACKDSDWAGCIHKGQHMLKFDASRGGSGFSRCRSGCGSEGESRGCRDDVIVERRKRDHPGARDVRCKCSNLDHPTHGLKKCETPEYELVVGSREGSVT